jgi:hypothetical protein
MTNAVWRWAGAAALAVAVGLACGCSGKPKDAGDAGDAGGAAGGPAVGAAGGESAPPSPPPGGAEPGVPTPPRPGAALFPSATRAERQRSQNNLKQIGLAFFNFTDTYSGLPVGIADRSGKPGLSWRVALLPFIEQENLYKQFKLDEPWNSEHNKKLIPKMPATYGHGSAGTTGYTYYRAFVGRDCALTVPPQGQAGQPMLGGKISAIPDGTSNTALVAEAADPVIWTKPDELEYDAAKPAPKLGGVFGDGFNVLLCDGSFRFVPKSTPEKTVRALITARGGEIVDLP